MKKTLAITFLVVFLLSLISPVLTANNKFIEDNECEKDYGPKLNLNCKPTKEEEKPVSLVTNIQKLSKENDRLKINVENPTSTTTNKAFLIKATATDPDDIISSISFAKEPYVMWETKECEGNNCIQEWEITEREEGSYNYMLKARNERNQTAITSIRVNVNNEKPQSFVLRTAAIDGQEFKFRNVMNYINSEIKIENIIQEARPYTNFNIRADRTIKIDYSAQNYLKDTDYLFMDSRLPTCTNRCSFEKEDYSTQCEYNPVKEDYDCTLESNEFKTSFIYKPFDTTLRKRNVVTYTNLMFKTNAPVVEFYDITDLKINEGETAVLELNNYVLDYVSNAAEIIWTVEESENLNIIITNEEGISKATISQKDVRWIGREILRFTAINPEGNSDSDLLTIKILNIRNNAPEIISKNPERNSVTRVLGSELIFSVEAIDYDYDPLTYTWLLNNVIAGNGPRYLFEPTTEGNYELKVTVKDNAPETSGVEESWTIRVVTTIETNPPIVESFQITPTIQEQNIPIMITAIISDDTEVMDAKLKITYPSGSEEEVIMQNERETDNYELRFTNTIQLGNYNVELITKDVFENENRVEGNFTITEEIDTQPPTVSPITTTPNLQAQNQQVIIESTVTDDTSVESVKIEISYPDSTKEEFGTTKVADKYSLLFTNTNQLGIYEAKVIATDIAGNTNNEVEKQFEIHEINPPLITNFIITPNPSETREPISISAGISDGSEITDVKIKVTYPDLSTLELETVNEGDMYSSTLTDTDTEGNYGIELTAKDIYNNEAIVTGILSIVDNLGALEISSIDRLTRNPIENLRVLIRNEALDVTIEGRTDENGIYTQRLEEGTYRVRVSSLGEPGLIYSPQEEEFNIIPGSTTNVNFELEQTTWWDINFRNKQELVVNNPTSEVLVDFPFLANQENGRITGINTARLISEGKLKEDCSDLRFINQNEIEELSFEFESINSLNFGCNTENTIIWLKGDLRRGNNIFYMYYGNPEATLINENGFNPEDVWSNGYSAIWHFGEGQGLITRDSTQNSHNLVLNREFWTNEGFFGYAVLPTETDDEVNLITNPHPNLILENEFAVEITTRTPSPSVNNRNLIQLYENDDSYFNLFIGRAGSSVSNKLILEMEGRETPIRTTIISGIEITDNTWRGLSISSNNANTLLYINGLENIQVPNDARGFFNSETTPVIIGGSRFDNIPASSAIDEVRISSVRRNNNWLFRSNNQQLAFTQNEINL